MSRLGICILVLLSVALPSNRVLARMHYTAQDLIPVAREFTLTAPEAPLRTIQGVINDSCFEPLLIANGDTLFSTIDADTDGLPHKFCEFDGQTYHDIWFQHIAECDISLTVST